MLDDLDQAVLSAVQRLTAETRIPADGAEFITELERAGVAVDETKLFWVLSDLRGRGYVSHHPAGGMSVANSGNLKLTDLGREALRDSIGPPLEPEQEALLTAMVEAARDTPRNEQTWRLVRAWQGSFLTGPGGKREVLATDVQALAKAKLIQMVGGAHEGSVTDYILTSRANARYASIKRQQGAPTARTEDEIRRFLDADSFRQDYPNSYAKLAEAQTLLWSANSDRELTTIGHKCREAMQEFATEAVALYAPQGVDPNPARINRRVGAVIHKLLPSLGRARAALLTALGDYSEATVDLIQRQEHGGQKEGQPLVWTDARRTVFSTTHVLFELASTFAEASVLSP